MSTRSGRVVLVCALLAAAVPAGSALATTAPGPGPRDWGGRAAGVAELQPRVEDLRPRTDDLRPRVEDLVVERPEATSIVLGTDVLFAPGSADLPPAAAGRLAGVVERIRLTAPSPSLAVRVEVHTDGAGQPQDGQVLSERRAAAVEGALRAALGPAVPPMSWAGFGASRPLVPPPAPGQDDTAARAANRRVEVTILR
ncbi:outer membrane protein OmpA-like peptidoglycan-associated protein [Kineococcus xinjiangensis]|uniref:Outer membrane protein OmpA-like peptidoglycan-associated protein n=1 Tax=Kineococcus xinjiangensis TaxID=512762 RepID=A0A2S6IT02_9ACTN|nr:OmpA family protein [Kineococcus xinjiangensis]PPK97377.1 outer membrane protein OmpA-like peptidoglycan-associated protein [Kineococcus xinjiangensis]